MELLTNFSKQPPLIRLLVVIFLVALLAGSAAKLLSLAVQANLFG